MRTLFPIMTALALAAPAAAQAPLDSTRAGRLARIAFPPSSANIGVGTSGKAEESLDEVATWAVRNPDGLVVLDGHADRTGEHRENVRLALDRAKAVRAKLVAAGVSPDQIVIAAFGDKGPDAARDVVIWGTRDGMDTVLAHSRDALVTRGQVAGR